MSINDQTQPQDETEQTVEERLAALEDGLDNLEQTHKVIRETTIKPRIEDLQDEVEEARQDRQAMRERLDEATETIASLRAELEAIAGLADDQSSNPEKRASDLRHILIRRAKASDSGVQRMYWEEIQTAFADLGHGEVSRPLCYDAIKDLAEQTGFAEDKKTSPHGNRVKAIRVDMDELHADAACKDVKTRNTPEEGSKPGMEVSNQTSG